MTKILRKIKKLNTKKALVLVLLAGMTAASMSSLSVRAAGPQFNIFPVDFTGTQQNTDLPMIEAKNLRTGVSAGAGRAIQAQPGDQIEFQIYYHNGTPDTDENVAIGTIIKAFTSLPLGTQSTSHRVAGTAEASNVAMVGSDDPGRGGSIAVNISSAQSISLVPGTTELFKNWGSRDPRNGSPDISERRTLDNTILTSGVNIGDVRGCWMYAGFVKFTMQVSQNVPGSLRVQKEVRNFPAGTFNDTEITANTNDTVEYRITYSAQTNPVDNVTIVDSLDPRMTVTSGPTLDGSAMSNTFFQSGGASLGTVTPGNNRVVLFQARVTGSVSPGTTVVIPNTARAFNSTQDVTDAANVRVSATALNPICVATWSAPLTSDGTGRGSRRVGEPTNVVAQLSGFAPNTLFSVVTQHVSGTPTFRSDAGGTLRTNASGSFTYNDSTVIPASYVAGDYNFFSEVNGVNTAICRGFRIEQPTIQAVTVEKLVKNDGAGIPVFQDQVDAAPGESVTFRILVNPQNSNQAITNVNLSDTMQSLGSKISFISNTLNVNGTDRSSEAGAFFSATGINIGAIQPNTPVTITFRATLASASNFGVGCSEILTNRATVTAAGLNQSDTANVRVCKAAAVKQPGSPSTRPN